MSRAASHTYTRRAPKKQNQTQRTKACANNMCRWNGLNHHGLRHRAPQPHCKPGKCCVKRDSPPNLEIACVNALACVTRHLHALSNDMLYRKRLKTEFGNNLCRWTRPRHTPPAHAIRNGIRKSHVPMGRPAPHTATHTFQTWNALHQTAKHIRI